MVHLCATFSADPSIMGLAKVLQQLGAGASRAAACARGAPASEDLPHLLLGRSPTLSSGVGAVGAEGVQTSDSEVDGKLRGHASSCEGLLAFSTAALHECVTGEKAGMLMAYLHLYCLMDRQPAAEGGTVQVRALGLCASLPTCDSISID
jgi:hypothetical protein